MKRTSPQWPGCRRAGVALWCAAWLLCGLAERAMADVVEMQNGDRYIGTVVSMGTEKLILQGDVLGRLELPRNQISVIALGPNAATNLARLHESPKLPPQPAAAVEGSAGREGAGPLSQLGLSTNLIQQVQRQFLSDAGPEAKAKFNELLGGLTTGKLNMNDLRAQARAAADQVRAMKKELGGDAGGTLDTYLGILDSFLKESGSGNDPTNTPTPVSPDKSQSPEKDE